MSKPNPDHSIFAIIGPNMVGPSSSHTAGAVRIGLKIREAVGKPISNVIFQLYNSFADTGKGHGTDKALLAGIMGFEPDDPRVKDAFLLAEEAELDYKFLPGKSGDTYAKENSVDITIHLADDGKILKYRGVSTGGGAIYIEELRDRVW